MAVSTTEDGLLIDDVEFVFSRHRMIFCTWQWTAWNSRWRVISNIFYCF